MVLVPVVLVLVLVDVLVLVQLLVHARVHVLLGVLVHVLLNPLLGTAAAGMTRHPNANFTATSNAALPAGRAVVWLSQSSSCRLHAQRCW
jgi:hypothetical protein